MLAALVQVMAVAKDQNGCRFLQRKFDEGGAAAIQAVLPEVLEHLIELMMDPFGNYLIQKLLDRCSEEQRLAVRPWLPDTVLSKVNMFQQSQREPNACLRSKEATFGRIGGLLLTESLLYNNIGMHCWVQDLNCASPWRRS